MKLENTRLIQAEPQVVWDSLVSVDVLKQCIPGCQSMDRTGENEYELVMKSKVGPVSATFKGELSLRDIVPGESYTLHFEGRGGAAGFSKGSAAVRLEPADGGTNLVYSVDASVGGKIAQIGQRLIDGAARKMADDFFTRFEEVVASQSTNDESSAGAAEPVSSAFDATAATAEGQSAAPGGRNWMWISGAVLVVILVLLWMGD